MKMWLFVLLSLVGAALAIVFGDRVRRLAAGAAIRAHEIAVAKIRSRVAGADEETLRRARKAVAMHRDLARYEYSHTDLSVREISERMRALDL